MGSAEGDTDEHGVTTIARSGFHAIRPLRRAIFRIVKYPHWEADAAIYPDWRAQLDPEPYVDLVPFSTLTTDISVDDQNPKTLFVTWCPKVKSASESGRKEDGLGLLRQHEWIVWYGDADGHAIDFSEVVGKSPDVHPRLCGAGLI